LLGFETTDLKLCTVVHIPNPAFPYFLYNFAVRLLSARWRRVFDACVGLPRAIGANLAILFGPKFGVAYLGHTRTVREEKTKNSFQGKKIIENLNFGKFFSQKV
jgi:hypothetical protein